MMSKLTHCLYIMMLMNRINGQTSTEIENTSYMLETFCPGDGLCLSNQTVAEKQYPDFVSCCTGCSCHDDCHLTKCCFPNATSHRKAAEYVVRYPHVLHRTCLTPYSIEYYDTLSIDLESYYMVTSIYDNETPSGSSVEACGDQIVAPWGSLYPVYSKKKDLIFKNSVCAEAYNVTDGVLWKPFLVCNEFQESYSFLNDGDIFHSNTNVNNTNEDCFLYFQPPENELDSHVCYIEKLLIKTCPEKDKFRGFVGDVVPFNLSIREIKVACTSGLLSPYRSIWMYANVFCAFCNVAFVSLEHESCEKTQNILIWERSGQPTFGFVGLLDIDVLFKGGKERTQPRMACLIPEKDTDVSCRVILCPSGKSHGLDGSCQFSATQWVIKEYELVVNISSKHGIDSGLLNGNIFALKRTWPKNWLVNQVEKGVKNPAKVENIVPYLLIRFRIQYVEDDPKILMRIIDNVLRRQWGLYTDDMFLQVDASIANFIRNDYWDLRFPHSPNKTDDVTFPYYMEIFHEHNRDIYRMKRPITITRMYFCDQIQLRPDEFILNEGPVTYVLYNKITGKYKFDGEFSIVYKDGVLVTRVCLDSSGLVELSRTYIIGSSMVWTMIAVGISFIWEL